jgi:hypothetical protein
MRPSAPGADLPLRELRPPARLVLQLQLQRSQALLQDLHHLGEIADPVLLLLAVLDVEPALHRRRMMDGGARGEQQEEHASTSQGWVGIPHR